MPEGVERKMPYLLGDGIYPDYALFIKPIKNAANLNENRFSSNREAARKDVERLYGVMKGRFQILRRHIRSWEFHDVVLIANTSGILHKFIVRMQQNGDFHDEPDRANMITEFLKVDEQARMESGKWLWRKSTMY